MRYISLFTLFIFSNVIGSNSLFKDENSELRHLGLSEKTKSEFYLKNKVNNKSKIIGIDSDVLTSRSDSISLELFEGSKPVFNITRNGQVWKGTSGKSDRFSLRKINGKYVGYILFNSRRYIISPLKPGISVLYEQDALLNCPMGGV